jgi:hypothetical protein
MSMRPIWVPSDRQTTWLRILLVVLALLFTATGTLRARPEEAIDDITGKYHFMNADDVLALLDEEGKLNGYIDVFQGEEESDTILSYPISIGTRKKNQVEFKTRKIHQKYYRFSGTVRRGPGHEAADPGYLELAGDLETITIKGESGEESVQRMHVVFKSMGRESDKEQ